MEGSMPEDYILDVTTSDNKYRLVQHRAGDITLYRWGEVWKEKVFDKCLLQFALDLKDAQEFLSRITKVK
jgi:hypothetical protein